MKMLPDLVMIHGAFCGGWAFDKFRKPFEERGYRVHAPDLGGQYGVSPIRRASTPISLTDYADGLASLVKGLDAPPILLGHSLGGLLAQMLAARVPISAAVLLAPSAPWGVLPSTLFEIVSAQTLFWSAGDFWNITLAPNYEIAASTSLDKLPPGERREVFARFRPESGLATFEVMHWPLDARRAAHVPARDVTCPILCLGGSEDLINPPSTVQRIAERYHGRAVFEELEGHSHWLIGEPGWERIAARACDWLDDVLEEQANANSE
jgi:pimeloyl-ACP methyl ester carboxylesterase